MKISLNCSILMVSAAILLVMGLQYKVRGSESAPFQVVRTDGKFELRDYPALTVVEAGGGTNADGSFMRLFRYIRGGNQAQQKISMTTPVFMSGSDTNATMAFVMPAKMNTNQVPKPSDNGLVVKEIATGRFAVFQFSGGRNAKNEAEALAHLQVWMKAQHLTPLSIPIYGYFTPPWIPGFFRHNEVKIRIPAK